MGPGRVPDGLLPAYEVQIWKTSMVRLAPSKFLMRVVFVTAIFRPKSLVVGFFVWWDFSLEIFEKSLTTFREKNSEELH